MQNIDAYVSGSIYPDSRYVTEVDRVATHPKEYRDDPMFRTNDFNKGWFAHLLADDAQFECMQTMLPQTSIGTGEESWLKRSAIKILQDIQDAKKFDLKNYLPCLKYIETPNGETIDKMHEYQDIFPAMYADIPMLAISDAEEMWKKFGVGEEIALKMRTIAEGYARDELVMTKVRSLYDAMLSASNTHLDLIKS